MNSSSATHTVWWKTPVILKWFQCLRTFVVYFLFYFLRLPGWFLCPLLFQYRLAGMSDSGPRGLFSGFFPACTCSSVLMELTKCRWSGGKRHEYLGKKRGVLCIWTPKYCKKKKKSDSTLFVVNKQKRERWKRLNKCHSPHQEFKFCKCTQPALKTFYKPKWINITKTKSCKQEDLKRFVVWS